MEKKQALKIAISQTKFVLGDIRKNREKISRVLKSSGDLDLLVFCESALIGYPPDDLLQRKSLIEKQNQELEILKSEVQGKTSLLLGIFTETDNKSAVINSAVLIQKDKEFKFFHKALLPNYDLFNESRNVQSVSSSETNFFEIKGSRFQVLVCEDLWSFHKEDPRPTHQKILKEKIRTLAKEKKDMTFVINSSPFHVKKQNQRLEVARECVKQSQAPLCYVNSIGAQDGIIFDGKSFLMSESQEILKELKGFQEDFFSFDLPLKQIKSPKKIKTPFDDIRDALVLGTREFLEMSQAESVCLGLSGGVDSAVLSCLLTEALGKDKVHSLALPSAFNSSKSLELAEQLAKNLGIHFYNLSITEFYSDMKLSLEKTWGKTKQDITLENLQARLRAVILMAFSNDHNSLVMCTSNKSESSTGYTTLYGDSIGALSPLGDLLKTQVYELGKTYYKDLIPEDIFTRPASAELKENQTDQDSLPPYEELDQMIEKLIHQGKDPENDLESHWLKVFLKNEFKRRQAPPCLVIQEKSFVRSLKWPIQSKIWF